MSRVLLLAMAGGVLLPVVAAAQDPGVTDLRVQLETLKRQQAQMQRTIAALEARLDAAEGRPAATVSVPMVTPEGGSSQVAEVLRRRTVNDNADGVARVDNEPLDPELRGFIRLGDTQTVLKVGGYAKVDALWDLKQIGNRDAFVTSTIPVPSIDEHNFSLHARQTRFNLDIRRTTHTLGDLRFFHEFDFFGGAGPRGFNLRHAYGQVANVLAGYSFSTFMDADAAPDLLDYSEPTSAIWVYAPQIRYTQSFGRGQSLAFAAERPQSDIQGNDFFDDLAPASPWPDAVVRYRYDARWGHLQASALLREVAAFLPSGPEDQVFGLGGSVSGTLATIGKDSAQFQITFGRAIARYFNDVGGDGDDAVPGPNGLEPLISVGGYGAYQHYWRDTLRSTLAAGLLNVDNVPLQSATAFHRSLYSALNLIWSPWPQVDVGGEVLYGTHERKDGAEGNDTRFQFAVKYNFIQE